MMGAGKKAAEEEGGFRNIMEIRIIENKKDAGKLSLLLKNSSAVFANTLRRLIVDELPNQVFQRLANQGKPMIFKPLPEPEEDEEGLEKEGESELSKRELAKMREAEKIRKAAEETGIRTSLELPQPAQEGETT